MSLLYIDGFDWIVNASLNNNYQGRWTNTGAAPNAALVLRSAPGASGFGAAVLLRTNNALTHSIEGGIIQTGYLGFRFVLGTAGTAVTVIDFNESGTEQLRLQVDSSGFWRILRGVSTILATGTTMVSSGMWNYIECKWFIHDSTGTFELRINGSPTPDIDLTGADTNNGLALGVDAIELNGSGLNLYYDDLYIDDAQFHGDVFVHTIVADGVGTDADFTPSAGSNFENVEELPTDNDSTYNESSVVDDRDRFTHDDLPADTDVVLGVQVGIWSRKPAAGDREVRVLAYDGVTEAEGAAHSPASSYSWLYDLFEDHPTDANPWTESEVNAGQFGYTVES